MKRALAFLDGRVQSSTHDVQIGVVWEFEVIDTSHDAWEVVVGRERGFAWLAHNCEHRGKTLEA